MNRSVLVAMGVLAGISSFVGEGVAQDYPSRAIRWVVPLPAGSPTDIVARKLGVAMADQLKVPIIVDNKPGAGATIGATEVARARPDGYTLLMTPNEPLVGATVLVANLAYDPARDFTFITRFTNSHPVLIAGKSLKANTLAELVEESKSTPGGLAYGSFGLGSFPHLILEAFARKTGAKFVHAPYQGSPPALRDLMADQIALTFGNFTIAPQVENGSMKVLAPTGPSWARNVRTFAEQGYDDPIFRFAVWNGLVGPANLPKAVVERNAAAAQAAAALPDIVAYFREISTPLVAGSPEEFEKVWRAEYETIPALMRSFGLTAN
jgi:tripartite-type tricarboxylate transporter receptor subunit TctC